MSNMSYCRFENTSGDLDDCSSALEEVFAGSEKLSRSELRAAIDLVSTCQNIIEMVRERAGLDTTDDACEPMSDEEIKDAITDANDAASNDEDEEGSDE